MNSAFVGYKELCRSRRVLSASAFGLGGSYSASFINIIAKLNDLSGNHTADIWFAKDRFDTPNIAYFNATKSVFHNFFSSCSF